MFAIFKKKELQKIQELENKILQLNTDVEFYRNKLAPIKDLESEIINLEIKEKELNTKIHDKEKEITELDKQIVELRNEKILQDFSFYTPI